MDIADVFDDFYLAYHDHMTENPAEKSLRGMGRDRAKKMLLAQGLIDQGTEYMYRVFDQKKDGEIESIAYYLHPNLYPNIWRLRQIIIGMNEKLQGIVDTSQNREALNYREYFQTFLSALESENPKWQDKLWRRLDKVWMKLKGRVQPIHMMETYEDIVKRRVHPSFVLAVYDDREPDLQKLAQDTKEETIKWLQTEYGSSTSLRTSLSALQNSQVGFYEAMMSGAWLTFKFAGVNVPNREDIRLQNGAKIFLISSTMRERWTAQKEYLDKIFGSEERQRIFADEENIIRISSGVFVAGHETAHNAFRQKHTKQKLGAEVQGEVEEDKSNLCIIVPIPDFRHINDEDKIDFLKGLFATSIRALTNRNKEGRRNYYYSALFIINTMLELGIFEKRDSKWGSHFEDQSKVAQFYTNVRAALKDMHQVYETMDPDEGRKYVNYYYNETDQIKGLEQLIGIDTSNPL